jgi:hypothetical protein
VVLAGILNNQCVCDASTPVFIENDASRPFRRTEDAPTGNNAQILVTMLCSVAVPVPSGAGLRVRRGGGMTRNHAGGRFGLP